MKCSQALLTVLSSTSQYMSLTINERRAKFTSLGSLTDAVIEWANSLNVNPSGTRL